MSLGRLWFAWGTVLPRMQPFVIVAAVAIVLWVRIAFARRVTAFKHGLLLPLLTLLSRCLVILSSALRRTVRERIPHSLCLEVLRALGCIFAALKRFFREVLDLLISVNDAHEFWLHGP